MLTVFLDLDGTLLETTEHFPRTYARVLADLGLPRTVAQVEAALKSTWPWYEARVGDSGQDELDFWRRFNARVCAVLETGDRAEEAAAAVTETFQALDKPALYDDVLPCLDALAEAGHPLGVLTARPDARRVIEPLGILERFTWLVDAFHAGSAKQDDRAFRFALELSGADAARTVHVGDQYDRDIVPAQAAGITAVLLDRKGRFPEADCPRLKTLHGLLDLLQDLP